MKFELFKSRPESRSTPQLLPTKLEIDEESQVQLEELRLSNCFLGEVLNDHRLKWVHVCPKGTLTSFGSFGLREGQSDYVIPTKVTLPSGGKGTFYLVNLDQTFTPEKGN